MSIEVHGTVAKIFIFRDAKIEKKGLEEQI